MDNLPHYSWILGEDNKQERITYDVPNPIIERFANYANELNRLQYHPQTLRDLMLWQVGHKRTIRLYRYGIPLICIYLAVYNGDIMFGLIGLLLGWIWYRIWVVHRSKRILGSLPGESIKQTINRRIKQLYINGAA